MIFSLPRFLDILFVSWSFSISELSFFFFFHSFLLLFLDTTPLFLFRFGLLPCFGPRDEQMMDAWPTVRVGRCR